MKWAFWMSVGVIFYAYLGYVGWLWVRAKLRPKSVKRAPFMPSVSVVMVVRNEEKVLDEKLRNLLALDYPPESCQLVVVSDGSTDGTERILQQHAASPRIHIVLKSVPEGKAAGLNDAMTWVRGEIVMFTDARQKVETGALRLLMENFADTDVGSASGELMLGDFGTGDVMEGTGMYWRVEKKIRELESASASVVGATGALYAARRDLVPNVPVGTILDDVFIPMNVVRKGSRVVFDQRARAWDSPNLGARREFDRKVRTLTGNYQLLQLAPWLLSRENTIRFEFVSHKILRLVVPVALAVLLAASLVLRSPFYRSMLVLQLAFYGLSLLSLSRLVRAGALARLADAAGTFVLLNGAAGLALLNFVTRRRAVWNR
jgi:poly-beta-1,6-N-acetyl-D-glucosamine synthase